MRYFVWQFTIFYIAFLRVHSRISHLSFVLRVTLIFSTLACALQAMAGFESKFSWCMVGHSGDAPRIPLVEFGAPPKTAADRLKVLLAMQAHAQYCMSGDHTVEATRLAIKQVAEKEADDYFVFAFSDANFRRYGIDPHGFGALLTADPRCVFSYSSWLLYLISVIHLEMPKD